MPRRERKADELPLGGWRVKAGCYTARHIHALRGSGCNDRYFSFGGFCSRCGTMSVYIFFPFSTGRAGCPRLYRAPLWLSRELQRLFFSFSSLYYIFYHLPALLRLFTVPARVTAYRLCEWCAFFGVPNFMVECSICACSVSCESLLEKILLMDIL